MCLGKYAIMPSFTNLAKEPTYDGDMSLYVYSFARPTRYTGRKKNGTVIFSHSRAIKPDKTIIRV